MKQGRIILLVFGVLLFSITCVFLVQKNYLPKLRGDSGFDSSYDSGGSSWDSGGSSWDSGGSSWSSSESDSYYSSGSSSSGGGSSSGYSSPYSKYIFFVTLLIILTMPFIVLMGRGYKKEALFYVITIILLAVVSLMSLILEKLFPNYNFDSDSIFLVALVLIVIYTIGSILMFKHHKRTLKIFRLSDVDEEKFNLIGISKEELMTLLYSIYIELQKAWMNFDYDTLKENLTDELYNQYCMQLDTLKVKNEKNIMGNFKYIDSCITDVNEENNTIIVTYELMVEFNDYIEKNGKVVRGHKHKKVTQHYEMVFVCSEGIKECSNCGHELDGKLVKECPYCKSKLNYVPNTWLLSKKRSISQY